MAPLGMELDKTVLRGALVGPEGCKTSLIGDNEVPQEGVREYED